MTRCQYKVKYHPRDGRWAVYERFAWGFWYEIRFFYKKEDAINEAIALEIQYRARQRILKENKPSFFRRSIYIDKEVVLEEMK